MDLHSILVNKGITIINAWRKKQFRRVSHQFIQKFNGIVAASDIIAGAD